MNSPDRQQKRDALRKRLRTSRRSLSDEQLRDAASRLQPEVLALLSDILSDKMPDASAVATRPRKIAGYLAFQGEIDVSPVMEVLRTRNSLTYVPMLNGDTLKFAPWTDETAFTTNRFGIVEPCVPENEWIDACELDAVLVPLVGFDTRGNRMGMGGGFYDKTFASRQTQPAPPWLIGVAHELQRVDDVFEDWWDVKLDRIVSA